MRGIFPRQPLVHVQTLEARTFLAAQAFFDPDSGLLHVVGDDTNDQIEVSLQFGVDGPGMGLVRGTLVTVRDHDQEIFSGYFIGQQLTEVRVSGGYGDDAISIFNDDSPIATLVSGDAGNDTIDAFIARRATPSQIYAGDGDDVVVVSTGAKALEGYVVLGEGGDDTLSGSQMSDVLYGDNESASFISIPGNDVIRGGGGNDSLVAGPGDDQLYGQDGDDMLDGGEGSDLLDGGAGMDRARIDQFDKFDNIEQFMIA